MKSVHHIFEENGGIFPTNAYEFADKLKHIKAYVFDWDGVFNNSQKEANNSSNFNEADSMGTNLLRFGYFLEHGKLPITAIISGEKNQSAFYLSNREHFTANYFKVADKISALQHLCKEYTLKPEEIVYTFDDVLDLSIAKVCGIRILIHRKANPLFQNYVLENRLADYITSQESGNFALRETCELLMGLSGKYDEIIRERVNYSPLYKEYVAKKNDVETAFFTKVGERIEKEHIPS
jgi:3-deoxy-D-manno-octulosonate 8-phosphate phosphatase (KDO 8-P phosphatase)